LLGFTPKEAYVVARDRRAMTQNKIDNGRLICLVGVSPLRPAEFVFFRIGQTTLEAVTTSGQAAHDRNRWTKQPRFRRRRWTTECRPARASHA